MLKNICNGILLLTTCCALSGCAEDCDQISWHDNLRCLEKVVSSLNYHKVERLTTSQFDAAIYVGGPDYKVTPIQLSRLLAEHDPEYSEFIMEELWRFGPWGEQLAAKWSEQEEFLECTIWVYDERKHFSVPILAFMAV
jgi:hypothetical protein